MKPIPAIDSHAGFRTHAWRRLELHPVAANRWATDRLRRRFLLLLLAEASPGSRSEFFQSIGGAFATPHRRASALDSGQQAAQPMLPRPGDLVGAMFPCQRQASTDRALHRAIQPEIGKRHVSLSLSYN